MQTNKKIFFNLMLIIATCLFTNSEAIAKESNIYKADSLFKNKKYTEAFSAYKNIFDEDKKISEQMLLKMAFIQEGLENYGECLYYLNTYQSKFPNPLVQLKINSLSEQNNLQGYENSAEQFLFSFLKKYFIHIQYILLGISTVFCVFFLLYLFTKKKKSYVALAFCLFFGLIGFSIIFISDAKHGVSINKETYLMNGASSASDVLDILEKNGHRFKILGKEDVWYKVELNNTIKYIHEKNFKIIP